MSYACRLGIAQTRQGRLGCLHRGADYVTVVPERSAEIAQAQGLYGIVRIGVEARRRCGVLPCGAMGSASSLEPGLAQDGKIPLYGGWVLERKMLPNPLQRELGVEAQHFGRRRPRLRLAA